MTRIDKLQAVLFGGGLLMTWVGVQLGRSWPLVFTIALIGVGIVLGGYQMLYALSQTLLDIGREPTRSQKVVALIQSLLQVGFGSALILGSIAAALIGTEGLWQLLSSQRGLIFGGIGAVLIALSVQVALGEGQSIQSGWELIASIPLRLASLPMLLIGLVFLAVGSFALLLPASYTSWVQTTFGQFINTP
jgi:hypothetical protein